MTLQMNIALLRKRPIPIIQYQNLASESGAGLFGEGPIVID